jgi:competence protein ComEA
MKSCHLRSLSSALLGFVLSHPLPAEEQRQRDSQRLNAPADRDAANKLDLNTADVRALEAIPVIGADAARAIVAARPFATIDELDRVQGISAERLEQIRAMVMVSTAPPPARNKDSTGAASPATSTQKPDINSADLATLTAIPSVGPETAKAIVAARPFATLDELNRVKGISAERLEQIRATVTVVPTSAR